MIRKTLLNRLIFIHILLMSLMNTGCHHHLQSPYQALPISKDTMPPLDRWFIKGKISIHHHTNNQNLSTNFAWSRNQQQHIIHLYGLFGQTVATIEATPTQAILKPANDQTQYATNIDTLFTTITGVSLPFYSLSYWIQGIADDRTNEKDKWDIAYKRFHVFKQRSLPTLIEIQHHLYTVKISIYNWSY